MDIKNKVVIISGASSGIGKAVAEIMAVQGARVALMARRETELNNLADRLRQKNADVLVIPGDVTDVDQVREAVNKTDDHFGRIDILINNAGLGYFGPLESMSMADFDKVVKTNLYGLMYMSQATIPYLKQSKGMIVNISSGLSKRALPFLSAYGGTKSMVDSLSDGMRMELRKFDIKVLNYCPPETDTEFHRNARKEAAMQMGQGHRKMSRVEDVANNIVKSIINEKREVVEGRFLKVMNFFAPKVLDNMFYKAMVVKMLK